MIIGIIGKRGSGKTLLMTKLAHDLVNKQRVVYTNIGFFFPHELLNKEFFQDYKNQQLQGCGIFIDEIYIYVDSRTSQKKSNRLLSYFFNQTRKRNVDLFYSTQFFNQVDLRLRLNTELFMFPQIIKVKQKVYVVVRVMDRDLKLKGKIVFLGNDYFRLYDTNEIIDFMGEDD